MLRVVEKRARDEFLRTIKARRASADGDVDHTVRDIIDAVRREGDAALRRFTRMFDNADVDDLRVPRAELDRALTDLPLDLRSVIDQAATNIRRFHERQRVNSWYVEEDGARLGLRVLPLQRVGLYVPGGTAAYPSSVLMNVIPAQVAGVDQLVLVSPPGRDGNPNRTVLATAALLGVKDVFRVGGAQAVAALAYGTGTIPAVDKIVGPGNAYVAAAKRMVFGRVDIDSIAGPTEIAILADKSADAEFVAADLLSQAEHDVRASAILVTTDRALAERVAESVSRLLPKLTRRSIAEQSIAVYGAALIVDSLADGVAVVNDLAPEHLEIMVRNPYAVLHDIRNAGAVFIGAYSSEPVGDYFAGPNHVLPTDGTARYASPLGVGDFLRSQSIVDYSEQRLRADGPSIVRFAQAEGLDAHALAVQVRLDRFAMNEEGNSK